MICGVVDKQAVQLRRILLIRTVALKAVGFGLLGFLGCPLLVIMSEPFGDISSLGADFQSLSFIVGSLGVLVLFFIQFIGCPFCKKFFFYNWVFVWVCRNRCVNCGRGVDK